MGFFKWLLTLFGGGASPEALTRKAHALAAKENIMAAVDAYKEALAKNPQFVPAYEGLGKLYFRTGFREEADREFAIADGLDSLARGALTAEQAVKMGRAMLDKNLYSLALQHLEPVLKEFGRQSDLIKVLALCHKALDNTQRAQELFREGLALQPRDPDFYLHLGAVELRSGRKEEGEKLIHTGRLLAKVASDPIDAPSRFALAHLFYARELFSEVAEYLRQGLQLDPNNAEGWLFLGKAYMKLGLEPAALDALNQAAKYAPDDPGPQQMLGTLLHQMGRFAESRAAKELAEVLDGGIENADSPQQGAKYVRLMLGRGKAEDAEKRLEELLAKWPDDAELRLLQGRILYKNKHYLESIDVLKAVAEEKKSWVETHIWLAMAYQRSGDKMAALAEGQLATRMAPKSYVAHKVLGDIYREQKKFNLAENSYEMAENLRQNQKKKQP